MELAEGRLMFAAHVVGSATVYATIQAAVGAAPSGGTVTVDAGTYAEQVTISKPLTVQGAEAGVDARGSNRATATAAAESMVTGALAGSVHTSGFYVLANDVTIDGFTVTGETSQDEALGAGIVIGPGRSGTHVVNDVVRQNVSGLFLANASATDPALIQHCYFSYNNNVGTNGGRGIYTDGSISGGNLTNVNIDANVFLKNYGSTGTTGFEAALAFEAGNPGEQSAIRITNNYFSGNGKATLFFNATNVLIQGNSVTTCQDQWSGSLRFEGHDDNVTILYNTIYKNAGPGVAVDSKGVPGDNFNFVVNDNNFYANNDAYGVPISVACNFDTYDGAFDARYNYWGAASGPSGYGPGTGDAVGGGAYDPSNGWSLSAGGDMLYSPWATATVTQPATALPGTTDYLKLAGDGITLDAWFGTTATGTPSWTVPLSQVAALTATPTAAGPATLTLDFTGGNPIPIGGLSINGATGATSLALVVVGTARADAVTVGQTTVTVNTSAPIAYAGLTSITVNGNGGADTITQQAALAGSATLALAGATAADALVVNGGTFTVPAPAAGVAVFPLASLSIGTNGRVAVATAAIPTARTLLRAGAFSDAGALDLGRNDLDVPVGSLSAIAALARVGFANGRWNGNGLASSAAAGDGRHLTGVGVIQNATTGGAAIYASFDGQAVAATDVLARDTYYGDTNLDGVVTAADYTRADAGFVARLTGWANGDLNYDGAVDGSDYSLIDNAFNQQVGAVGSPAVAVPHAAAATVVIVRSPATAVARATTAAAVPEPDDWRKVERVRDTIDSLR